MTSFTVEFWLVLQMVIEVLICIVIGYYFYREKSNKEEVGLEKEKIKVLMDSLNRFIVKSEDLDRKHQKVLKLWEKIERKGEEIEAYIDYYERKLKSAPEANNVGDGSDSVESGVACYEIDFNNNRHRVLLLLVMLARGPWFPETHSFPARISRSLEPVRTTRRFP